MTSTSFDAAAGQQQFLQLLVTQIQHQDPLSPMEQTEFLSQLAQFSTVEGIQQLNTRFEDLLKVQQLSQGTSLLGQTATYQDSATGEAVSGVIESLHLDGDRLLAEIGGVRVGIQDLQSLSATGP
ncbi:MAG: flagellar hook assembly protein FlgD [Planctomycetaceae bacterium]